ncbi:unnamed protein product [Parascedosporium putredinis]|uniref:Uncharacterized protein n=1 Tax=Parascedosporium putredinis TaxID=1442378 RepID=A0A9P1H0N0_9PEZI|nr:unnamed protein product [Parascedosporium putredinis]CAI7994099.1 unnamed protein product [Parascedosporium putredinis]
MSKATEKAKAKLAEILNDPGRHDSSGLKTTREDVIKPNEAVDDVEVDYVEVDGYRGISKRHLTVIFQGLRTFGTLEETSVLEQTLGQGQVSTGTVMLEPQRLTSFPNYAT